MADKPAIAPFARIPIHVLKNANLSPSARLLFALLWDYNSVERGCFPARDLLSADLGASTRTVDRCIAELVSAGLVSVRRRGWTRTNQYQVVTDHPFPESPVVSTQGGSEVSPESPVVSTQETPESPVVSTQANGNESPESPTVSTHESPTVSTHESPTVSTHESPVVSTHKNQNQLTRTREPEPTAASGDVIPKPDTNKRTKRTRLKKLPIGPVDYDPRFEAFWNAYPDVERKTGKKQAYESWLVIQDADPDAIDRIVPGLAAWKRSEIWKDDNGKFVPLPTTWLNQERYDSPPAIKRGSVTGSGFGTEYLAELRRKQREGQL